MGTSDEQQYMAGYNAGRTIALRTGSTEAGRRWLSQHSEADIAYIAGYEWALWDYEDANGLSHDVEIHPKRGDRTCALRTLGL